MQRIPVRPSKVAQVLRILFCLMVAGVGGMTLGVPGTRAQAYTHVPEAADFSTLVLQDPWDMGEYSDISQYLNGDGQFDLVRNVRVEGSIFSAGSTPARDAYFLVLFPGFYDTVPAGKTGARYPISSQRFRCLHLAMKVDSRAPDGMGPDQLQAFWFADGLMNGGASPWGGTAGIPIYPEAGRNAPAPYWKLFSIDLSKVNSITGWDWNEQPLWRGLRIDPTLQADVDFQVDWVRLTDCAASNARVSWSPQSGNFALWVRPDKGGHDIRVATNVSGSAGSATIDVQGLAPGAYEVGLGSETSCCSLWSHTGLVVNQTPIARFSRPSFTASSEYSTRAGNPWDFSDAADVTRFTNVSGAFQNGLLDLVTRSGTLNADPDPQVTLNTPQPFDGSQYRYLSFRLWTEGAWQRFGAGMVARLVWSTPGASGRQGYECHLVSQDIPFDAGWQVLSIDLFDAYNGLVEQRNGDCPGGELTWAGSRSILRVRFDPNENISGADMHQQLDWIRLNSVDRIARGKPYPIQVTLNKPPEEVDRIAFYFTTDLQQPTQHAAGGQMVPGGMSVPKGESPAARLAAANLKERIALPVVFGNVFQLDFPPVENGVNFAWNTGAVPPGEYYLCAVVEDPYNQATYCSEVPVQVIAP